MASLTELRLAKGWTQAQLAAKVGASLRAVKAWEAGENVPLPDRRKTLKRVLGEEPAFPEREPIAERTTRGRHGRNKRVHSAVAQW